MKKIKLQNIDVPIYKLDLVETLAYRNHPNNTLEDPSISREKREQYIDGYNEAKINYKYTEQDLRIITSKAFLIKSNNETILDDFDNWFNIQIKLLNQKILI